MSELIKTNRKLKHAEGLKSQYNFDSMKDVLYLTKDSNEIIFNDRVLGSSDLKVYKDDDVDFNYNMIINFEPCTNLSIDIITSPYNYCEIIVNDAFDNDYNIQPIIEEIKYELNRFADDYLKIIDPSYTTEGNPYYDVSSNFNKEYLLDLIKMYYIINGIYNDEYTFNTYFDEYNKYLIDWGDGKTEIIDIVDRVTLYHNYNDSEKSRIVKIKKLNNKIFIQDIINNYNKINNFIKDFIQNNLKFDVNKIFNNGKTSEEFFNYIVGNITEEDLSFDLYNPTSVLIKYETYLKLLKLNIIKPEITNDIIYFDEKTISVTTNYDNFYNLQIPEHVPANIKNNIHYYTIFNDGNGLFIDADLNEPNIFVTNNNININNMVKYLSVHIDENSVNNLTLDSDLKYLKLIIGGNINKVLLKNIKNCNIQVIIQDYSSLKYLFLPKGNNIIIEPYKKIENITYI